MKAAGYRSSVKWHYPRTDETEDKVRNFENCLIQAGYKRSKAKGTEYTFKYDVDGTIIIFNYRMGEFVRGNSGRSAWWIGSKDANYRVTSENESKLVEGSYKGDLKRLIQPELHIDQHRSKMGEDDDVIVVSFKVQGKEPANDLVSFLETGYDFILDADASPGEISPGKFLVFFELSRRTTAIDRIYQIVEEVLNLTLQNIDQWRFAYGTPEQRGTRRKVTTYPFTKENLEKMIPISPREYRDSHEEFQQDDDEIAAMKNIAQIPVNQTAPDDDEMNSLRQQAGLI